MELATVKGQGKSPHQNNHSLPTSLTIKRGKTEGSIQSTPAALRIERYQRMSKGFIQETVDIGNEEMEKGWGTFNLSYGRK